MLAGKEVSRLWAANMERARELQNSAWRRDISAGGWGVAPKTSKQERPLNTWFEVPPQRWVPPSAAERPRIIERWIPDSIKVPPTTTRVSDEGASIYVSCQRLALFSEVRQPSLFRRLQDETEELLVCQQCSEAFVHPAMLEMHMHFSHAQQAVMDCPSPVLEVLPAHECGGLNRKSVASLGGTFFFKVPYIQFRAA